MRLEGFARRSFLCGGTLRRSQLAVALGSLMAATSIAACGGDKHAVEPPPAPRPAVRPHPSRLLSPDQVRAVPLGLRPGALFARFGPPAFDRRTPAGSGTGCVFYDAVQSRGRYRWQFCFKASKLVLAATYIV